MRTRTVRTNWRFRLRARRRRMECDEERTLISCCTRPHARQRRTRCHREEPNFSVGRLGHSCLKATMGSARMARRAGRYPARSATHPKSNAAPMMVVVSRGPRPNSRLLKPITATSERPIPPRFTYQENDRRVAKDQAENASTPRAARHPYAKLSAPQGDMVVDRASDDGETWTVVQLAKAVVDSKPKGGSMFGRVTATPTVTLDPGRTGNGSGLTSLPRPIIHTSPQPARPCRVYVYDLALRLGFRSRAWSAGGD